MRILRRSVGRPWVEAEGAIKKLLEPARPDAGPIVRERLKTLVRLPTDAWRRHHFFRVNEDGILVRV